MNNDNKTQEPKLEVENVLKEYFLPIGELRRLWESGEGVAQFGGPWGKKRKKKSVLSVAKASD